jgi:hypothetical protein
MNYASLEVVHKHGRKTDSEERQQYRDRDRQIQASMRHRPGILHLQRVDSPSHEGAAPLITSTGLKQ